MRSINKTNSPGTKVTFDAQTAVSLAFPVGTHLF